MIEALAPLRSANVFSHFDKTLFDHLASVAVSRSAPRGARVYRAGDASDSLICILDGIVCLERQTPNGPFAVGHRGKSDLVGDVGFVLGGERYCDARCERDCEFLILDRADLGVLLAADPAVELPFYWALWKSLSGKLRVTNGLIAGFFDRKGAAPQDIASSSSASADTSIRVDISAKRHLFEEQSLSTMEINFLAALSREERFAPGQLIFSEGEDGDSMYVVLDGQVMISKFVSGAGEEALDFIGRGDYFGEMALIDHQPRSAFAKAHQQGAVVLAIPKDVLEGILDIHRVSSIRLLKILCNLVARRLRQSEEKLLGWYLLSGGAPGGTTA